MGSEMSALAPAEERSESLHLEVLSPAEECKKLLCDQLFQRKIVWGRRECDGAIAICRQ